MDLNLFNIIVAALTIFFMLPFVYLAKEMLESDMAFMGAWLGILCLAVIIGCLVIIGFAIAGHPVIIPCGMDVAGSLPCKESSSSSHHITIIPVGKSIVPIIH